ncbi:MAG: hypothetical protein ACOYCE_10380 [Limnochordia bacterium]|jgi:hypothetical protein|nr:hypothetical protein [Bacillota bacterium]
MESQFLRSLLFALILFVLVSALGSIKYPALQRLEEYIAFVLTTDFDFAVLTSSFPSLEVVSGKFDLFRLWPDSTAITP